MFSLDNLTDNTKIYVLGLINRHNNYNYTKINYFDIYYNNEIINPFIDKLIDLNYPIYQCKYIDWYSCISQYDNTKYKKYFINWLNECNNSVESKYNTGLLSKTYKNRNDYLTISILYDIYDKEYLKYVYNNIPINKFNYLNEDVYIYELPSDTKDFIIFNDYIHSMEEPEFKEINEINESLYLNKIYKKKVDTYIINLKDKKKYFYKKL